jgi:hypothetical protein
LIRLLACAGGGLLGHNQDDPCILHTPLLQRGDASAGSSWASAPLNFGKKVLGKVAQAGINYADHQVRKNLTEPMGVDIGVTDVVPDMGQDAPPDPAAPTPAPARGNRGAKTPMDFLDECHLIEPAEPEDFAMGGGMQFRQIEDENDLNDNVDNLNELISWLTRVNVGLFTRDALNSIGSRMAARRLDLDELILKPVQEWVQKISKDDALFSSLLDSDSQGEKEANLKLYGEFQELLGVVHAMNECADACVGKHIPRIDSVKKDTDICNRLRDICKKYKAQAPEKADEKVTEDDEEDVPIDYEDDVPIDFWEHEQCLERRFNQKPSSLCQAAPGRPSKAVRLPQHRRSNPPAPPAPPFVPPSGEALLREEGGEAAREVTDRREKESLSPGRETEVVSGGRETSAPSEVVSAPSTSSVNPSAPSGMGDLYR